MKTNSIVFKLFFLVLGAYAVTMLGIFAVGNNQILKVIDQSIQGEYNEKVDSILGVLERKVDRLRATTMEEVYEDDFKESVLIELRKAYYGPPDQHVYPFIIDGNGMVVMHPELAYGEKSLAETDSAKMLLQMRNGDFVSKARADEGKWYVFKHFKDWDWLVAYVVPKDIKYGQLNRYRKTILFITAITSLFVFLLLTALTTKLLGPIARLTKASIAMAEGDLEQEIEASSKDELGILAKNFQKMRDSIKNKISELEQENKERRRVEEELKIRSALLSTQQETSPDGILVVDENGRMISFNRRFVEMWGIPQDVVRSGSDEAALNSVLDKLLDPDAFLNRVKYLYEHTPEVSTDEIALKDGSIFERYSAPMTSAEGEHYGRFWQFRDITERKRAEEQIGRSLEEKSVLLKEIHHRVKNNMNVIISLLNLQVRKLHDGKAINALKEGSSRIRTMARVHEMLYGSRDFSAINVHKYFELLVSDIFRSYNIRKDSISATVRAEGVSLEIDHLIPCGLIVNELVSNSFKHAFRDDGNRRVNIRMSQHENLTTLAVEDNGIGLPEDIETRKKDTLGLELVDALVRQLQGELTIETSGGGGSMFKVAFKIKKG